MDHSTVPLLSSGLWEMNIYIWRGHVTVAEGGRDAKMRQSFKGCHVSVDSYLETTDPSHPQESFMTSS